MKEMHANVNDRRPSSSLLPEGFIKYGKKKRKEAKTAILWKCKETRNALKAKIREAQEFFSSQRKTRAAYNIKNVVVKTYILAVCENVIIGGYNAIMNTKSRFHLGDKKRFPRKKATRIPRVPAIAEGNLRAHSEKPNIQTERAIKYICPRALG
jgi:hypothetical protein